ncbi:MAG: rhodanese-like domain-containing protein [Gammaproteobacteria bacterium]
MSAALPLLIEPAELHDRLGDPALMIVDLRDPEHYAQNHLPGALSLGYGRIVRANPPVGGLLPTLEQLSAVLSALGLTPAKHVVAYDGEGGGRAARLLWTLDAIGHAHFGLLNGGIVAWTAEGRPLTPAPESANASDYRARIANPAVIADKDYILAHLGRSDFVALDVRSPEEYGYRCARRARRPYSGCAESELAGSHRPRPGIALQAR